MSSPPPPEVPDEKLQDWEQTETEINRLFDLGLAHVDGHTLVYEDTQLRGLIQANTGKTDLARLFFATRIQFVPSLPPGGERVIRSRVINEVETAVADRFRQNGFTNITTADHKQLQTDSGARARVIPYDAEYEWLDTIVPIEGFAGVWSADGFRIAGGAYPTAIDGLDITIDRQKYRSELLELIAAVR